MNSKHASIIYRLLSNDKYARVSLENIYLLVLRLFPEYRDRNRDQVMADLKALKAYID